VINRTTNSAAKIEIMDTLYRGLHGTKNDSRTIEYIGGAESQLDMMRRMANVIIRLSDTVNCYTSRDMSIDADWKDNVEHENMLRMMTTQEKWIPSKEYIENMGALMREITKETQVNS
jgi:hypothetical protein